jgi:hypothetical protein
MVGGRGSRKITRAARVQDRALSHAYLVDGRAEPLLLTCHFPDRDLTLDPRLGGFSGLASYSEAMHGKPLVTKASLGSLALTAPPDDIVRRKTHFPQQLIPRW